MTARLLWSIQGTTRGIRMAVYWSVVISQISTETVNWTSQKAVRRSENSCSTWTRKQNGLLTFDGRVVSCREDRRGDRGSIRASQARAPCCASVGRMDHHNHRT